MILLAPLLVAAVDVPPPAPDQDAVPIPAAIRSMLDAALESGNDSDISTIVKYARTADPASGDAVLAIAQKWRSERDAQRREVIQEANFLDLWSGSVQIGGFRQTGNTDLAGITGVADLTREGLRWRHKFHAQADYQQSQNVTTREHYLASYEPNFKINDRTYIYGALQYESDRFLGYRDRFSTSAGLGYSVVKSPAIALDLELGPAYRHTAFTDDTVQNSAAARGNMDFNWKLTRGLSVSQVASAYIQQFNSTVSATSALNAKLLGPLSAQLSYNVQYESMPPAGSVTTDTTSRASLVYSF